MKFDLLLLQIAVIFFPGIIWARLDASFAAKTKPSDIEFFIRSFIFGMATYAGLFLIYSVFGWSFIIADFTDASTKTIVTKDVLNELLWATLLGIFLAIIWLYAATYKWISKFLQLIRATRKYGDEDVWDFTFNSTQAAPEYVHFRDFTNFCVYAGWVNTFSETEKLRELVLRDVIVYDFEGVKQFELPLLYIARPPENIHIEFPYKKP